MIDLEKLRTKLIKLARKRIWCDREDFIAIDIAGGHADDTYYAGCSDGETLLARELMKSIFGETVTLDPEED